MNSSRSIRCNSGERDEDFVSTSFFFGYKCGKVRRGCDFKAIIFSFMDIVSSKCVRIVDRESIE